jgi:translation elongation factor EF-Ts
LLEQAFVKNPDITVREYAARTAAQAGAPVDIVRFERMVLGETNPNPRPASAC